MWNILVNHIARISKASLVFTLVGIKAKRDIVCPATILRNLIHIFLRFVMVDGLEPSSRKVIPQEPLTRLYPVCPHHHLFFIIPFSFRLYIFLADYQPCGHLKANHSNALPKPKDFIKLYYLLLNG